jgi:hypothetical protein
VRLDHSWSLLLCRGGKTVLPHTRRFVAEPGCAGLEAPVRMRPLYYARACQVKEA